jgi:molybdopterin molybdotransferase
VRPALLAMMGARECTLQEIPLPAGFDAPTSGARQEYLRVRLMRPQIDSGIQADVLPMLVPLSDQSSGVLSSVVYADGLAIVPPFTAISSGQLLRFLPFGDIV